MRSVRIGVSPGSNAWRAMPVQRPPQLVVMLHGLPAIFASSFGFDLLATASTVATDDVSGRDAI
ncbi:MAG: hypothetical protein J2P37_35285 [Ktedonobacteraceae bacterium]|nr:hypothetical protein [Ktedonobacteraceae bacterium]MBO0793330.1 hypothetical protein [Ktedonobacteraceae bacterium]